MMNSMKASDQNTGFTLLEVLVALTITALILGAVVLSLGAWARANDRAREHMELFRSLQKVMDRIYDDISSIYVSPFQRSYLYAGFETFDLESIREPYDAFTFSSLAHRSYRLNAKESEFIEMTYFTVEDEGGSGPEGTRILRRREGGVIDDRFEVEGGTVYDMAYGVTHLIFDYLAPDGDLKHEWRLADSGGKLPCAVVVKIGLSSAHIEEVNTCAVIPVYLTNNSPCRYEHDTLEKLCQE
jgi:prepilin-type N-terminal cleavage/methylation domain-containing protein